MRNKKAFDNNQSFNFSHAPCRKPVIVIGLNPWWKSARSKDQMINIYLKC